MFCFAMKRPILVHMQNGTVLLNTFFVSPHLIRFTTINSPRSTANFGRANQENGRRCYLEMETESSRDGRLRGLKMWACRHTNRVWRGRERSADVVHYPQRKVEIYGESLNVPVFAISLNREYLQACLTVYERIHWVCSAMLNNWNYYAAWDCSGKQKEAFWINPLFLGGRSTPFHSNF